MSTRIEVELTSVRDDGSWTWRAAGAKQPKGVVEASLLPEGTSVGDVVRAEAEMGVDGTHIVAILTNKRERKEPELLTLLGSGRDDQLVTTTLVERSGRGRGKGRGRGRDGYDRRGGRGRSDRDDRGDGRGRGGRDGGRPEQPKAKRLRPGRAHRNAALEALPEEQRPVAEQVMRGGVPAVRAALAEQNEALAAAGKPTVESGNVIALAERLAPTLKAAEWRDRAEAAKADVDEIDLRDLRSVVGSAESAAKDEESRALAAELREALTRRAEAEHQAWLSELNQAMSDGRIVRALRLSSRPPKAGVPIPAELAERMVAMASSGLTSETGSQRFATVVDAMAFSPLRERIIPESIPEKPSEELLAKIAECSERVPHIAEAFGVPITKAKRRRRGRSGGGGGGRRDGGSRSAKDTAAPEQTHASDTGNDADGSAPEPPEATAPEAVEQLTAESDGETASGSPDAGMVEAPEAADGGDGPQAEVGEATDTNAEIPASSSDGPEVRGDGEAPSDTNADAVAQEANDAGAAAPRASDAETAEAPDEPAAEASSEPEDAES